MLFLYNHFRDLSDNRIQEIPELKNKRLEILLLGNNSITSLPSSIGNLKELNTL